MKTLQKLLVAWLAIAMLGTSSAFAQNTNVNLDITPGIVTLFAPDAISLWTVSVSSSDQYVTTWSVAYNGSTNTPEAAYNSWLYFGVKDMMWASSWFTVSIKVSNLTDWAKTISSWNVTISQSATDSAWTAWDIWSKERWVTKMDGLPWNIIPAKITAGAFAHDADLDNLASSQIILESQDTDGWRNEWFVWRYWVQPEFKIKIPAYQALGNYAATLTVDLAWDIN